MLGSDFVAMSVWSFLGKVNHHYRVDFGALLHLKPYVGLSSFTLDYCTTGSDIHGYLVTNFDQIRPNLPDLGWAKHFSVTFVS